MDSVSKIESPLQLVEINCQHRQSILQEVFESDQSMRTNGGSINARVDRENLATVVSLIEKCGMPTLEEVTQNQMMAIWLVFQHGDNASRKKYLPQIRKSVENGDLEEGQLALMEDRILVNDGKPQIYGSQFRIEDGDLVLYELANPETVDKRRAKVGLEPLSEYLNRFNIKQVK